MTITTDNVGFETATMRSTTGVMLDAERRACAFYVCIGEETAGQYYVESECREAAEFFTMLANELERSGVK